jgi:hypothetical protein
MNKEEPIEMTVEEFWKKVEADPKVKVNHPDGLSKLKLFKGLKSKTLQEVQKSLDGIQTKDYDYIKNVMRDILNPKKKEPEPIKVAAKEKKLVREKKPLEEIVVGPNGSDN